MQGTWVQSLIQKIPHAVQQLSPCALTTEPYSRTREPRLLKPRLLEPVLCDKRSPHSQKPVHCSQKVAPAHGKESEACAQQRASTARLHANMHTLLLFFLNFYYNYLFYVYVYFILLYNTVLVLPYIDMNPPRVYMRSQTWTPSHLPPHKISLGHHRAPAPSMLYPALDIDWWFDSYMIVYMFQCHSPKSSYHKKKFFSISLLLCLHEMTDVH